VLIHDADDWCLDPYGVLYNLQCVQLASFARLSEILVENRDFSYLRAFRGGPRRNIAITFGVEKKTRMAGILDGVKN